ncbi:hAD superfamily hydrolase [Clostridium sp. CAG:1000]|nr:hAD superfamily hydrolase [Clostridium sp. CAG:1000]
MNKKVLVVDYDRTLFINNSDMLNNINSINKFRENGNIFIIATGRTYNSLKKEIDKYNIEYDYLILNHGSLVIKKDKSTLFHYKIDKNILFNITNYLSKYKPKSVMYSYYTEDTNDINNPDISKITIGFQKDIETFKKVMMDVVKKYNNKLNIYFTQNYEIELISKETNKSRAIDLLMKKANFKKENIYTIGDSYTDIDMINDYNGSCMEKSIDILKNNKNIKKYSSVSVLIKDILNS